MNNNIGILQELFCSLFYIVTQTINEQFSEAVTTMRPATTKMSLKPLVYDLKLSQCSTSYWLAKM